MHLLNQLEYEPGSTETKATTGTHSNSQDVDAVNLALPFAPDTTRFLLEFEGNCLAGGVAGDNVHVFWVPREGSSDLDDALRIMRTVNPMRCYASWIVTIPEGEVGIERTVKWGQKSSSATIAANLRMGGAGTSAAGPATMRAYSIAEGTEDLLAHVRYDPDPAETPTMNSSTYADVPNVPALAFTHTGPVLVEAAVYAHVAQRWTLRDGTTNLTSDGSADGMQAHGSDNIPGRITCQFGLDADGAESWKLGWRRNATQIQLFMGTDYGPADLRVWNRENV